jgi:hypothetical protein
LVTRKDGTQYWTKVPYQCTYYREKARSNDPSTWESYQAAVAAVGTANGIGFMLKNSVVGAADLDHVRDVQTGELIDWAQQLCVEAEQLGLYREVTVSGRGLRFIGLAQGDELDRKFTFDRNNGAAIELYRNCERYITISGLQEGSCKDLGQIGDYLDTLLARFDGQAVTKASNTFDFNTAGTQKAQDYYRNIIENGAPEGERSERFQEGVWHLANLGWSIEQIVDELAKYPNGIGLKYANRLLAEVTRSFGKWQSQRRASVTGTSVASAAMPWPQIRIKQGELPRVINEAEIALLALGREIYQRGGQVVRPVLNQSLVASDDRKTESWQLIPMTRPYLVEQLSCAAQFLRFDKRMNQYVIIDPPYKVAEGYLNRRGKWKLPLLTGIVNAPFLRRNGSICEAAGYDDLSHVLFKPDSQVFPPVPQTPGKAEALIALGKLIQLISTFPFVTPADRSVILAGILTALDRKAMPTAPLIGLTAPTAGTGKSLLVDMTGVLATGRKVPVTSQGKDENEFEKRLGASLLAGDICISIDNCDVPLSGVLLCQVLTQDELNIRELGFSRVIKTPMNATIFANGNNLSIVGDLTRRCLLCSLDAGVERPELRPFSIDVIKEAQTNRGELVVAALTILRAWHLARAAGERLGVEPFGSFEDWSWRVREALIWLGEADPCDTTSEVRENDPMRDQLTVVLLQWQRCLGVGQRYTVQEVINRAVNDPPFYTALTNVAMGRIGNVVSNDRLGRWLKRFEGKIVGGLRLVRAGTAHAGYPLWTLSQG